MISKLFLDGDRQFPGMRWVNIVLRTLHLIGVTGVGGAFLYEIPVDEWRFYILLTLGSGLFLMLLAIWSNGIWFIQLRGVATMAKLALLSFTLIGNFQPIILFVTIAISGIIAHAPGKVRYYFVFPDPRLS